MRAPAVVLSLLLPLLSLMPSLASAAAATMSSAPAADAAATKATAPPLDVAALDAQIETMMRDWQQPGLAIAIVADGRIVHERGFGVRDASRRDAVDAQTLFGIASLSKSFASATVAKLVADGRIGWDDPVQRHLPWFQMPRERDNSEVTVRDLLAMRSGFGSSEYTFRRVSADRRDHVRRIRYLPQLHPLRSQFLYTTDSYTAIGEVVAETTGMPWEGYAAQALWQPLGMSRTHADHALARRDANAASPHLRRDGSRMQPIDWIYEDYNALPAGGVNSTAHDLALWLRFQLGDGSVDGRPLLPAAALHETHVPQTPERGAFASSDWADVAGEGADRITFRSYAMGWMVHAYRGHTVVWHSGGIDGFRSRMGFVPELGIGIVVLANSDQSLMPLAVFQTALDHALGRGNQGDWSTRFRQRAETDRAAGSARREALEEARIAGTHPSLKLPAYAGCYADAGAFGKVAVRVDGDRLSLEAGRLVYDLQHWHHDVFKASPRWPYQMDSRDFFVDFRVDPHAQIAGFGFSTGYTFARCA
ncbi:serine hydrolase [Luteimonas sp. RIT-PG2_3]